jgi:hypothetical protein
LAPLLTTQSNNEEPNHKNNPGNYYLPKNGFSQHHFSYGKKTATHPEMKKRGCPSPK